MEKENTKKIRYSFKKSACSTSGEFIEYHNLKDNIDECYYGCVCYGAHSDEHYHQLKKQLENENRILFEIYLKEILDKYPILLNCQRTKKDLEKFESNHDLDAIIDEIVTIILNLDKTVFETINTILAVYNYDDTYGRRIDHATLLYTKLKREITANIYLNMNLKKIFKIMSSKEAGYRLRNSQYSSKSESYKENKSRKWRKRQETDRRRKDRRETKQNID